MSPVFPPAPANRTPWLFSAPLDLLIGCGAWSVPLLALTLWLQQRDTDMVALAFYVLALFCNYPHYMATIHRAYHHAADFRKYRFFTVYVTVVLALSVALVHLAPVLFPWVITLYLTWSPWHYTGQNFGIAQMLVRRAGAAPDPAARQWLFVSYASSYALWFLTLHAQRAGGDPYFVSLNIPEAIALPLQVTLFAAFAAGSAVAFHRLARQLPWRALAGPLVLTATQLLWFIAPTVFVRTGGAGLPVSYFSAGALAFMHCAQYLWVTSYYARRETRAADDPGRRFSFWQYYLMLVVGGIALFVPGPWIASRLLGQDHVRSFMIFMALVNLHHFILDGAIWKLRDGRIARLLLGTPGADPAEHEQDRPSLGHYLGWLFRATTPARVTRVILAAALMALAVLDQWQNAATSRFAGPPLLTQAAALNPADPRGSFRLAQRAATAGDTAGAIGRLRELVRQNPDNAPAQFLLGELLMRASDAAGALAQYSDMFDRFPRNAGVARNRGLAAVALGQHGVARASFARAVRLDPAASLVHFFLGRELAHGGETGRAAEEFETAIAGFEAAPELTVGDLDVYCDASLARANQLMATDPAGAERRLQRAADVSATYRQFGWAARLLARLADAQETQGKPAVAAQSRQLGRKAAEFAASSADAR